MRSITLSSFQSYSYSFIRVRVGTRGGPTKKLPSPTRVDFKNGSPTLKRVGKEGIFRQNFELPTKNTDLLEKT
jgi:hypothetical protein